MVNCTPNIPDPCDPRWSEFVQAWPAVRRCLMLLDSMLVEAVGPDHVESEHSPATQHPKPNPRPHQILNTPVDELCAGQLKRFRASDMIEPFQRIKHLLTLKQWEAVWLHFGEELSQAETASKLNVCQSAISNRLKRAQRILENQQRALRDERFAVARRYVELREET